MKSTSSGALAYAALANLVFCLSAAATGENSPDSPRLLPAAQPSGGWTLQWQGLPGRTYFVQNSHDLKTWTYLDTIQHGEGVKMEGVFSNAGKYFLRLRHTDIPCADPETADFDRDGLSNTDELFWATDPFNSDSDSDGFLDGWEVVAGWNPNENNGSSANLDPDADGWDNATEHLNGTRPDLQDTDGDQILDPDDADPNDPTIDWPRTPEASRVWLPLNDYDPASHGAPMAVSNTGIALFEKALWKGGVWMPLEWEKNGPELSYPDPPNSPLPLPTTLRGVASLDLADDGSVLGHAQLVFDDPHGAERAKWIAVQWTEQAGNMIMEIAGEHTSGGLDLNNYDYLPTAEGVSPDGVIFTRRPTDLVQNTWQWGRHGQTNWKNPPEQVFLSTWDEFVPRVYHGGVWIPSRNTISGGKICVYSDSGANRLLTSNGTTALPSGDVYLGGALDDGRLAMCSAQGSAFSLMLPPKGSTTGWRPVPKLAGAAAFNARGEAISHDGRFWQNGKWLVPVSEDNEQPSGPIHLHDLSDGGVMLASAGEPAGGGEGSSGLEHGSEAGLIVPVELYGDLNNDGQLTQADIDLVRLPYQGGASEEDKDKGTEFMFANDSLSNGAWDKEDTTTPGVPGTAADDDAEELVIKHGIAEGEVWLDHPAIGGLKFYKTRKCTEEIPLSPNNHFTITSANPFPEKVFVRADSVNFPDANNPQMDGDLKLMIKLEGNSQAIETAKMKLTVVREMRAKKYFQSVRDYIFENNTAMRADDKKFPEGSTSPTSTIRVCLMLEEKTSMYPFESYWADAYAEYLASDPSPGTSFDPAIYTRWGFGIDGALAADSSMTVVVNGNQCDFTDPSLPDPRTVAGRIARLADLTAMASIGESGLTNRCHGRVVINGSLNPTSSDLADETALAPGTSYRGSPLAGDDPVAGTSNAGGKYIAQSTDGKFTIAAGRVPIGPAGPPNAMGGLSTSYGSSDRDSYPNSFVGHMPMQEVGKGIVFVAAGKGANGNGRVQDFYEAAKASGVPEIPGATPAGPSLPIIRLVMLDSGDTSCALIHKTPGGEDQTIYKGNKHDGFPYYTNTFLRFKAQKPRSAE